MLFPALAGDAQGKSLIVPWAELTAVVDPAYPKVSEAGGRPPIALERMLRIYLPG